MSRVFTIDDGTQEFTLKNQYGQTICTLHFRPNDLSLFDRYNETKGDFANIVKPLEGIDINADGTAGAEEGMAVLHEAEELLRKALKKLLDSDDADAAFTTRNPFSSVGGKFFCENVINAIGQMIEIAFAEEMEASAKRTAKYIESEDDTDAGETAANT